MADQPDVEDVEAQDEQVDTNVAEDDNGETQEPTASAPAEQEYENPADAAGGYTDVPEQSEEEEWLMKVNGCLVALIVASCAELAQAVKYCKDFRTAFNLSCDGSYAFAIAVGATSLTVNVLFGAGLYFRRDMFKGFVAYLAIVMVLLWGFGVAILTFAEPFISTGNGYFATWGAAIISVYFAQISFEKFNALLGKTFTNALSGTVERRVMMLIMIFSFVFAYACVTNKTQGGFSSQEKWGFACGMTSGGLIVVYMLLKAFTNMVHGNTIIKYISYILVTMWLFGVGVCTFEAPFLGTGNGYFTAWGSFLASIYLAYLLTVSPTAETPSAQ